jgi:hypothetical protein
MTHKLIKTNNYLLVVDESVSPVTDGNYYYADDNIYPAINCRYVFAKKILAHLPLGNLYFINLPLLPKYNDADEKSLEFVEEIGGTEQQRWAFKDGYIEACKKYKYTEEDIRKALLIKHDGLDADYVIEHISNKYPTEFDCEMVGVIEHKDGLVSNQYEIPKTITTAQGVQWVGKYK